MHQDPRPVEFADETEWLRMRAALWPHEEPEESARTVRQFLVAPDAAPDPTLHAVLVCPRAAGGLCGFVELSIRPYAEGCETNRVGYIEGWYVDPDARHQGVGRQLIIAAEGWARGQGCSEMASDAELDNTASQQAHQRLGYTEIERIVCFRKALTEEG
jgi:aminoglycoside 6'-N-acetyltransferase I